MVVPITVRAAGKIVEIVPDNARTHKEFPAKATSSLESIGERRKIVRSSSAPSRVHKRDQLAMLSFSNFEHSEATSPMMIPKGQCRWNSTPNIAISADPDDEIDVAPVLFRRTTDIEEPSQIMNAIGVPDKQTINGVLFQTKDMDEETPHKIPDTIIDRHLTYENSQSDSGSTSPHSQPLHNESSTRNNTRRLSSIDVECFKRLGPALDSDPPNTEYCNSNEATLPIPPRTTR
eukprot:CAMPEP_0168756828 /NCGR_PEP_ID=MMETSP0724-20121128/20829_1 /TAXON_ID=265536 /ORGANISM="Amphiprora sp., Strain CCMP467" /LENGTH=232 /DNA_ID=CAMNT_0008805573 /DNA_START=21 /DNA_END=716 /DNA_ORIENTATION=+